MDIFEPISDKYFDTLVYLGPGEDPGNCITVAEEIYFIDANNNVIEGLKEKFKNSTHVTTHLSAIGLADGTAIYKEYNLTELNGCAEPEKVLDLYPGLATINEKKVTTQSISQVIDFLGISLSGTCLLVVNLPGIQGDIISDLANSGLIKKVSDIIVFAPPRALFKNEANEVDIKQTLLKNGYETRFVFNQNHDYRCLCFFKNQNGSSLDDNNLLDVRKRIDALQTLNESLEKDFVRAKEKEKLLTTSAQEEKKKLTDALNSTKEKLTLRDSEVNSLKALLDDAKKVSLTHEQSQKRLSEESEALKQQLCFANEKVESIKRECSERTVKLSEEVLSLKSSFAQAENINHSLENKLSDRENKLNQLKQQLLEAKSVLDASRQEFSEEMNKLKEDLVKSEGDLKATQSINEQLEHQHTHLERQLKAKQNILNEKLLLLNKIQKDSVNKSSEITNLQMQNKKLADLVTKAEAQLEILHTFLISAMRDR